MASDGGDEHEMGAGGKLTKRSLRSRVSASPYARPPVAEKSRSGWFSKLLVKPAARILPSLFSTATTTATSSDQHQVQDQDGDRDRDESLTETEQEHATVSRLSSDNQFSEPKESGVGLSKYGCNDHAIAEIEQQLRQKKFSRDETERLIELLRSRTIDLRDEDGHVIELKPEDSQVTLGRNDVKKSAKEDSRGQSVSRMMQISPDHYQLKANDVSSSPVDVAKAYMETRISASGYDSEPGRLKIDNSSFCTDNSASKPSFTPVAKSSMCWPGAIMQNDRDYFTPRRGGVVHYPRTPYSGSIFSKSTTKLQVNSERPNRSSAAQSSGQVFGRNVKTATRMNSILDSGFAPVSPIRHIRQKNIAATSTGAGSSASKGAGPTPLATPFSSRSKSVALGGSPPANERDNLLKGGFYNFQQDYMMDEASRFAADSTPVHPQSTVMARKILEHLDRSLPSPKEKLLEINLARKRAPLSETLVTSGQQDRADASISSEQKKAGCLVGQNVFSQEIMDAQKVFSGVSTSTFSYKNQPSSHPQSSNLGMPTFTRGTSTTSAAFKLPESQAKSDAFRAPNGFSRSSDETSIPPTLHSEKLISSDNGFSFTFPVSAAPSAFSEPPPTPTMPSSPASTSMEPPAGEESVPSFSFGSAKPSDRLVFSFGSSVSSSEIDTATPSFKFGSEKKSRLSFKPIGGDTICYS